MQIVTLAIKALAWCSMLVMIGLETNVYVCEARWIVRFGVVYALVGDAVLFNLVLSVSNYYTRFVFIPFIITLPFSIKTIYTCVNFGIL